MREKVKLIIEVDKKYYEACKDAVKELYPSQIEEIIAHGTVLPKGHGDLIDRNALITELETDYHNSLSESGAHLFVEITNYIDEAETIIEAEKENSDGSSN